MWKCPKCGKKVDDSFEICWACGTTVDGVENPHFLEEGNVGQPALEMPDENIAPESLVTLTKCSLPPHAHAIRVRLESEGIPVFLFDEFTITMDWLLSNAIGGVKVQVPEPYLERAREILGIVEEEMEDADEEGEEDEDFDEEAGAEGDDHIEEGIIDKERLTQAQEGIVDQSAVEGIRKPPGDPS